MGSSSSGRDGGGPGHRRRRVHLVTLGCPKNAVDSEVMAGRLDGGGWELVADPDGADVIVVNTCSFIRPAVEESLDTVLEMARRKASGACRKLVVTGCMVQRYGAALEAELPEVDHFLGTGELHLIDQVLRAFPGEPVRLRDERDLRVGSGPPHSAYLKISEGCDRRCSFCLIPRLRGGLRSRSIASLEREARELAARGARELNLVSQDSTAYGRDLAGRSLLPDLLRVLCQLDEIRWIRLLYAYPLGISDELLAVISEEEKVCSYLDMPLQHASTAVLRAMRRGLTGEGQERMLERVRAAVPGIALRTTFIAGFPGETEADFEELLAFVRRWRFERVGVFVFHREEETAAAELPDQVPEELKEERRARLMEEQARISLERNRSMVGRVVPVMLDGRSEESDLLLAGRMGSQAPEVDGHVLVRSAPAGVQPGDILPCRIVDAAVHDLVGELLPG